MKQNDKIVRRSTLRLGLVAIVAMAALSACGKEQPAAPEPRLVRTMIIAGGAGGDSATYTAEIRSRYETDLSFQVGGKMISRTVDVGANVKKGDVLARLDQTDQSLGVEAARASVNSAQAELNRARSEEERYRDLLERGLTTRAAYLTQQTAVKTNQSRLEQATSDLRLRQQQVSYTTLRADQDGIVTRTGVEVGQVVAQGQRVLSIARPSELEAVFDVPDGHLDDVRGDPAVQFAFLTSPGTLYPARIREISPTADPATRTYQVRASIKNAPSSLHLGMTVSIRLANTGASRSVSLPATALFQDKSSPAVWIVKTDRTLELRPVTVDRYDSDRVLVSEGISQGERVVTAGVHRLTRGEKIRTNEESRQ